MARKKEEIFEDLARGVVDMDEALTVQAAHEAIAAGIEAYEAITGGLTAGMEIVSQKYEQEEYFVPEVLICSDAMYAGLEVLRPHLKSDAVKVSAKVVIGVVEGDTHDIGKNLVKIMLEASGLEMHDLGRDVPPAAFVDKAEEIGARMICMSTLMSTTMDRMKEVVDTLKLRGIREKYRVLVGGGPISQSFADGIGADGYAPNAAAAVKKADMLLSREVRA